MEGTLYRMASSQCHVPPLGPTLIRPRTIIPLSRRIIQQRLCDDRDRIGDCES
jgi:hypothetical protein